MRALRAVAVVAAMTAGCGVPQEDAAVVVRDDDVPFGLLAPSTTTTSTTSTTTPPVVPDRIVNVCFVQAERVVPVERTLERRRTLAEVVEALRRGPTDAETAEAGLDTALPAPEAVGSVTLQGGTVTVALGEPFTLAPAPQQLLAIAQLVCTLTGQPGVGRVQFLFDSQPIQVPLPDGSLSAGSVSRDDYAPLIAPATPSARPAAGTGAT